MIRRLLLTTLVLAVVTTTGCSNDSDQTDRQPRSGSSAIRDLQVTLPPARKPLFGSVRDGDPWRTAGYTPSPVRQRPYSDRVLVEDMLPAPVDDEGVRYYERDGESYYHPVAIAQFALAKLDVAERTGRRAALRSAKVNAAKLLDVASRKDGGLYYPYPFDFPLGGKEREAIRAPWWSAMAQGQALSLFSRLSSVTGQQRWREAADRTFRTMDDQGPRNGPWSVYLDERRYLWFEEYAGNTKPLLVLNGDLFAIFGLWDYHRISDNARAAHLFDAGVTTMREYLPYFREPGDVSYYCLRGGFCRQPLWQNKKYHGIVITQMRILADMTDDPWFRRQAAKFHEDFADF